MTAHAPLVETGAIGVNSTPLNSIPSDLNLANGTDRSFSYVALPFFRAEKGEILRGEPVEFRDCLAANVFARMLAVSASNCGAIVLFQRHGEDNKANEVFVVGSYGDVGRESVTG